ncbi:MAG: hypothetical protein NTW86_27690 [Candidatus Sumerlaeota bacterium]|nr:hypothetical protein [Candidatus Sumerlaeota bacterium]
MSEANGQAAGSAPARRPMNGKRKLLFGCLAVVLALVFALAVGEIVSRLFLPNCAPAFPGDWGQIDYVSSAFCRHMYPAREKLVYSEQDPRRLLIRINRYGYRGEDFSPEKPQGVFRIAFTGGSAAFDPNASEGEDWPHRVQAILRARGYSNVECINAGVPGHASCDVLGRLFSEIHELRLNVAVFYNFWNDAKQVCRMAGGATLLRSITPYDPDTADPLRYTNNFLDSLLCHSRLYAFLRYAALERGLRIGPEGAEVEGPSAATMFRPINLNCEPWGRYTARFKDQYRLGFQTLVDCARNAGIEQIISGPPTLLNENTPPDVQKKVRVSYIRLSFTQGARLMGQLDDILRQVAREKKSLLIDLAQYSGRADLLTDAIHPSREGNAVIAKDMADFLEQQFKERIAQAASSTKKRESG